MSSPGELSIWYLRSNNERSSQGGPTVRGMDRGAFCRTALVAQRTARRPPPDQQQPGAGAQVHTGTSSGLTGDARVQNLLTDHQYFRVQSELDELPPEQAQLYRGILANRNNDPRESIELLEPLMDKIAASGDAVHEKLAAQGAGRGLPARRRFVEGGEGISERWKAGCRAR